MAAPYSFISTLFILTNYQFMSQKQKKSDQHTKQNKSTGYEPVDLFAGINLNPSLSQAPDNLSNATQPQTETLPTQQTPNKQSGSNLPGLFGGLQLSSSTSQPNQLPQNTSNMHASGIAEPKAPPTSTGLFGGLSLHSQQQQPSQTNLPPAAQGQPADIFAQLNVKSSIGGNLSFSQLQQNSQKNENLSNYQQTPSSVQQQTQLSQQTAPAKSAFGLSIPPPPTVQKPLAQIRPQPTEGDQHQHPAAIIAKAKQQVEEEDPFAEIYDSKKKQSQAPQPQQTSSEEQLSQAQTTKPSMAQTAKEKPKKQGFFSNAFGFSLFGSSNGANAAKQEQNKQPPTLPNQNQESKANETATTKNQLPFEPKPANDADTAMTSTGNFDDQAQGQPSQDQSTNNKVVDSEPLSIPMYGGDSDQEDEIQPQTGLSANDQPSMFSFLTMQSQGAIQKQDQLSGQNGGDDSEEFEQVEETRDMIEDKLFRNKLVCINLTIKQHGISEQIVAIKSDIERLGTEIENVQQEQIEAGEREDFEMASELDSKIGNLRGMANGKEGTIRSLRFDSTALESQKSDRQIEQETDIREALEKLQEIQDRQARELEDYQKTLNEELASKNEKQQKLKEEAALTDTKLKEEAEEIKLQEDDIEKKVFTDTKSEHEEKHKINAQIEDIDSQIDAIQAQLALLQKRREMCLLERQVYDRQINQARSKYMSEILCTEVARDDFKLRREQLQLLHFDIEEKDEDLKQQTQEYQTKLSEMESESNKMTSYLNSLRSQVEKIQKDVNKKRHCLEQVSQLGQLVSQTQSKLQNQQSSYHYQSDKIQQVRKKIVGMHEVIDRKRQVIEQCEADKKMHAKAKKFREASTCQNQVKKITNEIESDLNMADKLQVQADDMEKSISAKKKDSAELQNQIDELTVQNECQLMELLQIKIIEVIDLIESIEPYCSSGRGILESEDAQNKQAVLQGELAKMKEHYYQLCTKYEKEPYNFYQTGPKAASETNEQASEAGNSQQNIVREDSQTEEIESDKQVDDPTEAESAAEQEVKSSTEPEVRSYEEVLADFKSIASKIQELEEVIEFACADEDYDKAEQLQNEVDSLEEQKESLEEDLQKLQIKHASDQLLKSENAKDLTEAPADEITENFQDDAGDLASQLSNQELASEQGALPDKESKSQNQTRRISSASSEVAEQSHSNDAHIPQTGSIAGEEAVYEGLTIDQDSQSNKSEADTKVDYCQAEDPAKQFLAKKHENDAGCQDDSQAETKEPEQELVSEPLDNSSKESQEETVETVLPQTQSESKPPSQMPGLFSGMSMK